MNFEPPTLRRAGLADAPVVTRCVEAAYSKWIAIVGRRPWPMLQDYAAVIATGHVVVAEAGGQVAGVLVCSETAEGFLIDNVAVFPEHQGGGVGRALLLHAEREAALGGHESVYLYTNELMAENIALYLKIGYVEYERRREVGFCRVFLRKRLVKGMTAKTV